MKGKEKKKRTREEVVVERREVGKEWLSDRKELMIILIIIITIRIIPHITM